MIHNIIWFYCFGCCCSIVVWFLLSYSFNCCNYRKHCFANFLNKSAYYYLYLLLCSLTLTGKQVTSKRDHSAPLQNQHCEKEIHKKWKQDKKEDADTSVQLVMREITVTAKTGLLQKIKAAVTFDLSVINHFKLQDAFMWLMKMLFNALVYSEKMIF